MHRFPVIFLLFASTALAQQPHPVITSVVPNSGPSSGGTKVTITGEDFFRCPVAAFAAISACSPGTPPAVLVGSLLALSVTLVDTTRLEVTMPPYPPGAADVSVKVAGFGKVVTATAPKAFTFTGSDTFDPVLLPILTPQT
ncbi:MAG TPA: IPT/TIG domain-containing protein, partial [Thermoanaerobaculia bacterium]